MAITNSDPEISRQQQTERMLDALGLAAHRYGYLYLCLLIPRFAEDFRASLTKDLYPYAAAYYGYSDWRPIERAIRDLIISAWLNRDPEVWAEFFPNQRKPPSNKQFIAALAKKLR